MQAKKRYTGNVSGEEFLLGFKGKRSKGVDLGPFGSVIWLKLKFFA